MRKFFSLLTAILLATSLFAADDVKQTYTLSTSDNGKSTTTGNVKWTIGSNAIESSSSNTKLTGTITVELPANAILKSVELTKSNNWGQGATVTFASGTTSLKVFSDEGSFTLTSNETDETYTFKKTGTSSKNAWVKSISVTYEEADPDAPSITASNISLGTVQTLIGTKYEKDIELDVVGANLTEAIAYEASSEVLTLSGTLTAEGGKLNVHVAAPVGDLNETITLTSGTASKTVKVTGKIEGVKAINTYSVAEAIAAFEAGTLEEGDSLILRGVVTKITKGYYSSIDATLKDATDAEQTISLNELLSFDRSEFSLTDGIAEDANGNKFAVGDTLVIKGKIIDFYSGPEISYECFVLAIYRDETTLTPEILATPKAIALETADAVVGQKITLAYNYWKVAIEETEATLFSDAECTEKITEGAWISNLAFNEDYTELTFDIAANDSKARTAYIRIYALGEDAETEAQVVVKVSQARYIAPATKGTYGLTELANITASDVVIITMSKDNTTYALGSDNGTNNAPKAVSVTPTNGEIEAMSNAPYLWNIAKSGDYYIIYLDGETDTWLYSSDANNGVRVGSDNNKTWTIASNYLKHVGTGRYMGVYNGSDWRAYNSTSTNISGQKLGFYVLGKTPTSISNTASETKAVKTIVNGQLLITRDGKVFNVLGQPIR